MSWCGGGLISPTPGGGGRVRATPGGNCPPATAATRPGPRHPRVDLAAGQLATLTGLGPLRHLDLDVIGVDQVLAGDAEPAAGHLLDRRPAQVAVGVGPEEGGVLRAAPG